MADEEQLASIPLVEERVAVSKQDVETGRLRVKVSVDEREETVAAELARDEVEVRRVPRNAPLAELPAVRMEGDTTIIPVVEEVMVIEKRLVLVEEIHVVRKTRTTTEDVAVTLRSETADIEREGSAASSGGTARWRPA